MFVSKAGAYPTMEHQKYASLRYAPSLHANIRQGWIGLQGRNTFLLQILVNYGRKKFYNMLV